jgi:hypothetical protein
LAEVQVGSWLASVLYPAGAHFLREENVKHVRGYVFIAPDPVAMICGLGWVIQKRPGMPGGRRLVLNTQGCPGNASPKPKSGPYVDSTIPKFVDSDALNSSSVSNSSRRTLEDSRRQKI